MDIFTQPFLFNKDSRLSFDNPDFWIVLVPVILIYSFIYKINPLRNGYLFLVSVFIYYKTGGFFFAVMLIAIIINYLLGFAIHSARRDIHRKIWLAVSVIASLGILGFFKYEVFIADAIDRFFGTNIHAISHATKWAKIFNGREVVSLRETIPPVGISFFTFQCMSYTIDIYRRHTQPVRLFTDFAFYISFFPQLVMGPIIRAAHFIPQLYKKYSLSIQEYGSAFYLILKGLVKKLMVANFLANNLSTPILDDPAAFSGIENLMALFGYSVRIYCDFSGYTDIAIGLALLLGFRLPKNFNSPYKAKSIQEFWKRWHISLSSWLKDYLYIPLGGNRRASYSTYISLAIILVIIVFMANQILLIPIFIILIGSIWLISRFMPSVKLSISTNINLLITMLLGGLWHGTTWMFVIWGGLHGMALIVNKFWRKLSPYEKSSHWLAGSWKTTLTFLFVTFTWSCFEIKDFDRLQHFYYQIGHSFGWDSLGHHLVTYWRESLLIVLVMIIHWLPESLKVKYRDWFSWRRLWKQVGIAVVVIFMLYQFVIYESDLYKEYKQKQKAKNKVEKTEYIYLQF